MRQHNKMSIYDSKLTSGSLCIAAGFLPLRRVYDLFPISRAALKSFALSVLEHRPICSVLALIDAASLLHSQETRTVAQRVTRLEADRWLAFIRQPVTREAVSPGLLVERGFLQRQTFGVETFRESFNKVFVALLATHRLTRSENFPKLRSTALSFPCISSPRECYEDRLVYWYDRPHAPTIWNVEMAQWLWSSRKNLLGELHPPITLCPFGKYKDLLAMFHPLLEFSPMSIALDLTRTDPRRQSFPERLERLCTRSGFYQFLRRIFDGRTGLSFHSLAFDFRHLFCTREYTGDEPGTAPTNIEIIPVQAVAEMPRSVSPGSWHTDLYPYPDRMTDRELVDFLSTRISRDDWLTSARSCSAEATRSSAHEFQQSVDLIGTEAVPAAEVYLNLGADHETIEEHNADPENERAHETVSTNEDDGDNNEDILSQHQSDLSSTDYDEDVEYGQFVPRYLTGVDWVVFDDFSAQLDLATIVGHLNCEDMTPRSMYSTLLTELARRNSKLRITLSSAKFDTLDRVWNTSGFSKTSLIHEVCKFNNTIMLRYKCLVDFNRRIRVHLPDTVFHYFDRAHIFDLGELFQILYTIRNVAIGHVALLYTDRFPVAVWKFDDFLVSLSDRGIDLRLIEALVCARRHNPRVTPSITFDALYRIDAYHVDNFTFCDEVLQRSVDKVFAPCTLRLTSKLYDDVVYDCDEYTHARIVLSLVGND